MEGRYGEFGLHLYYCDERIVIDALCGPQVFADGEALVGRVPSVREQWMLDRAAARPPDTELVCMDHDGEDALVARRQRVLVHSDEHGPRPGRPHCPYRDRHPFRMAL